MINLITLWKKLKCLILRVDKLENQSYWDEELCDGVPSEDISVSTNDLTLTGNVITGAGGFVYSTGNSPVNGIVSTIIPTVIGENYTFSYNVGFFGSTASGSPDIMVTATSDGGSGGVDNSQTSTGTGPATTYTFSFTATSDSTEIAFTDVSTSTISLDAYLSFSGGLNLVSSNNATTDVEFRRKYKSINGVVTSEDWELDNSSLYTIIGTEKECECKCENESNNEYCPLPFASFFEKVNQSETVDLSITGSFFTTATTVSIAGLTVNSVTFISDNEIMVNVTTSNVNDLYDIVITNECGDSTITDGLQVELSTWVDLRLGGDAFTDGNAAGNDIRYRSNMSMTRDAQGMFFTGSNPWQSWVKFESLGWTRGGNKTLQWILTSTPSAMMIGISSDATNETANDQYRQSEVNLYLQNANTMWGLYGNNGTPGGTGNQAMSTSVAGNAVLKVKFENDGGAGSTFTIYGLPSANPSDWDDESNVINTFTIGGSLNPDEANLFPAIIPRSGGTQRFIALKID